MPTMMEWRGVKRKRQGPQNRVWHTLDILDKQGLVTVSDEPNSKFPLSYKSLMMNDVYGLFIFR